MPTFHIEQFGCRATQADGAVIERQLLDRGCTLANSLSAADVVVLNTCTVTAAADAQARDAIRKLHTINPATRIIVTGCYAQRAPEELAALPGQRSRFNTLCAARTIPCRQHFRSTRSFSRSSPRRRIQPHPPNSKNPGRLQQPLLLLRYPVRSRKKPQSPLGNRRSRSPQSLRLRLQRNRPQRHQSRRLGPRPFPTPKFSRSPPANTRRNRGSSPPPELYRTTRRDSRPHRTLRIFRAPRPTLPHA